MFNAASLLAEDPDIYCTLRGRTRATITSFANDPAVKLFHVQVQIQKAPTSFTARGTQFI